MPFEPYDGPGPSGDAVSGGGVPSYGPGGGSVDNFPWDAVLPTYEGGPKPASVNKTANPRGPKLPVAAVGDWRALSFGITRVVLKRMTPVPNDAVSADIAFGALQGPIQSIDDHWINGLQQSPFLTQYGQIAYTDYLGTDPQSLDSWLDTLYTGETLAGSVWVHFFAQVYGIVPPDGWGSVLPGGGKDDIELAVDGHFLKLYDPRTATTIFSRCPPLVIAYLLMTIGKVPSSRIDWTSFGDAADICDALISGESRFTFDGTFATRAPLDSMIDAVRLTCNAEVYVDQGKYKIWIDVEQAGDPVLTLDERTNFEPDTSPETADDGEMPTRVIVKYPNAANGFQYDSVTLEVAGIDSGDVDGKEKVFTAEGVTREVHARRIAAYTLNQRAVPARVSGTAAFEGILLKRGDKVRVITLDGLDDYFLVSDVIALEDGRWKVQLRQYNAAVYADAAIDGTIPPNVYPPAPGPGQERTYIPIPPLVTSVDVSLSGVPGGGLTGKLRIDNTYGPVRKYGAANWSATGHTSFAASQVNDWNTATSGVIWDGSQATQRLTLAVGSSIEFRRVDILMDGAAGATPTLQYSDDNAAWTTVTVSTSLIATTSTLGGLGASNTGLILTWASVGDHPYWRLTQSNQATTWIEVQFAPVTVAAAGQTGAAQLELAADKFSDAAIAKTIGLPPGGTNGVVWVEFAPTLDVAVPSCTFRSALRCVSPFGLTSLWAAKVNWPIGAVVAAPPDPTRPQLLSSGLVFEAGRTYTSQLWGSSYWSHINLSSWDATKVNDGSDTGTAGTYGPSANSYAILNLGSGNGRKFGKLRWRLSNYAFEDFSSYWLADAPVVQYSDDGSTWTSVTGAKASLIRTSAYFQGYIIEFDLPASTHQYWRAKVGLGTAAATLNMTEAQFYEVTTEANFTSYYEVRAGVDASGPLLATVLPSSLPSSTNPVNVEGGWYATNAPYTGAGPLNGEIVRYLDVCVVAVNLAGVKSSGVVLFGVGSPVGVSNTILSEIPEHSAGLPSVAASGRARIVAQGGKARVSENAGSYKPILTQGGSTPGVSLQATAGTPETGHVNISGTVTAGELAVLGSEAAIDTEVEGLRTVQADFVPPFSIPMTIQSAGTVTVNSTTAVALTDSYTLTPATDCVLEVIGSVDARCDTTGAPLVVELKVDSGSGYVAEAEQIVFEPGAVNFRLVTSRAWRLVLTGGTSYTLQLYGRVVSGGGPAFSTFQTHTGFTGLGLGRL